MNFKIFNLPYFAKMHNCKESMIQKDILMKFNANQPGDYIPKYLGDNTSIESDYGLPKNTLINKYSIEFDNNATKNNGYIGLDKDFTESSAYVTEFGDYAIKAKDITKFNCFINNENIDSKNSLISKLPKSFTTLEKQDFDVMGMPSKHLELQNELSQKEIQSLVLFTEKSELQKKVIFIQKYTKYMNAILKEVTKCFQVYLQNKENDSSNLKIIVNELIAEKNKLDEVHKNLENNCNALSHRYKLAKNVLQEYQQKEKILRKKTNEAKIQYSEQITVLNHMFDIPGNELRKISALFEEIKKK